MSFLNKCPNGHALCLDCKNRIHNCCPTCLLELGNIRCLALEKVAELLEFPCRYQSLSYDIFPYYSKLKHEQHCQFRPYCCPYAGSECSIMGDIHFVAHLKNDHSVDMHDGGTFNHRYVKVNPHEVENATWMPTVFNCYGRQFCLHLKLFSSVWHQSTCLSYDSWVRIVRRKTLVTLWKLVDMGGVKMARGSEEYPRQSSESSRQLRPIHHSKKSGSLLFWRGQARA